jgi:site-specific DNA recombinase
LQRLIADGLENDFQIVLAMDLSCLARGSEFLTVLREEIMLDRLHIVTLNGMVNTLEDDLGTLGFYDWLYEKEVLLDE